MFVPTTNFSNIKKSMGLDCAIVELINVTILLSVRYTNGYLQFFYGYVAYVTLQPFAKVFAVEKTSEPILIYYQACNF